MSKKILYFRSTHKIPGNFIVTLLLHCSSLRFLQRPKFPPFSKFLLNFNVGFCKIEFLSKSGFFFCKNRKVFSNIYLGSIGIKKCVLDIKKEPAKHSMGANLSSFVYDVLNCKITLSPLNIFSRKSCWKWILIKVEVFWEGHKNFTKSSSIFWR